MDVFVGLPDVPIELYVKRVGRVSTGVLRHWQTENVPLSFGLPLTHSRFHPFKSLGEVFNGLLLRLDDVFELYDFVCLEMKSSGWLKSITMQSCVDGTLWMEWCVCEGGVVCRVDRHTHEYA